MKGKLYWIILFLAIVLIALPVLYIMSIPLPDDVGFYTKALGTGKTEVAYRFNGASSISCFSGTFVFSDKAQQFEDNRPGGARYNPEDYPIKTRNINIGKKIKILKLLKNISDKGFSHHETAYGFEKTTKAFNLPTNYSLPYKDRTYHEIGRDFYVVFHMGTQESTFLFKIPDTAKNEYASLADKEIIDLMIEMIDCYAPEDATNFMCQWVSENNGNVRLMGN